MKTIVDDIMDKIPEQFNMVDIMAKVEERTPYVIVAFQVIIFLLLSGNRTKLCQLLLL